MTRMRLFLAWIALAGLFSACGGSSTSTPTTPAQTPTPVPANPCSGISLGASAIARATLVPSPWKDAAPADHDARRTVSEALWRHQSAAARGLRPAVAAPTATADLGEIAVLQDEGDIIAPANPLDVRGTGLTFRPSSSGGYDVVAGPTAFRAELGSRLTLADDDSSAATLPFGMPFYGTSETAAFVNSDGNITFDEGDHASTERDITRLVTGPARVAPFLADLDPSKGGGVFVDASPSAFTVTWCQVPGFDSTNVLTAQVTLWPDGRIDLQIDAATTLTDAVVGLSPGRGTTFNPVNLAPAGTAGAPGGDGAFGERFSASDEIDTVALARKFFASHPDGYDQVVIWTDRNLVHDAFAYELTVANEIQGIGVDVYDSSRHFGSSGRLRSLVVMDDVHKYPDDPATKFNGENNTLSLVGQESGHRWLVFIRFLDAGRQASGALLGRDEAHWSFFMDSDASVMEGNDIQDLGGGAFRTVAAVQRYSLLDQYSMGLVGESEVPPFFYVESPVNVVPARQATSAPLVGVTFNGTRRDVLIQDVVAALGPRVPSAAASPRLHRQAFVYLLSAGRTLDRAQVEKIDRIRLAWEGFFSRATDGRMRAETRLRP